MGSGMDSYTPHAVWSSFVSSLCVATLATTLACEPFALPSHRSDASAASDEAARDTQPGAGDSARPGDAAGDRAGSDLVGGPGDLAQEDADPDGPGPQPPGPVDDFEAGIGEEAVLAFVNDARASIGLPPMVAEPHLAAAAAAHASFLVRHREVYDQTGTSAHIGIEGLAGFTGKTFTQRLDAAGYEGRAMAEVVAFKPSSVGAARSWMESLYHRLPLLDPAVDEAGFGETAEGARYANVLEMGQAVTPIQPPEFLAWPPRDARDVPTSWDGAEIPQPPPPPAGYPSGPVVTLHATGGALVVSGATIAPEPAGGPVAMTSLTSQNDPNLKPGVLSLIPHRPLSPNTTYRVRVEGTVGDAPFAQTWTFTTRGAGCSATAQDCGAGQGCYLLSGKPSCLWSGTRREDSTCEYVNDCGPGLTCFGSRCRPLCDNSTGDCQARCKDGVGLLGAQNPVAVCLPPSCITDTSMCLATEGCYWVGAFACDWAGELPGGAACKYSNDCEPGYGCLGLAGDFRCRALCGGPDQPSCQTRCPGGSQVLDPTHGVRFCQ
jgi:hypothetical protein